MPNYKIPTTKQCYEILKQCRTPKHIVRHCEVAADLAVEIAKRHSADGTEVDIDFVHRACLLHDILRLNGRGHEEDAYQFLRNYYPELAVAIRKHA